MTDDDATTEKRPEATGVAEAVIGDLLLALGVDDPLALTPEERLRAIESAAANGRVSAAHRGALRELGVLPATSH